MSYNKTPSQHWMHEFCFDLLQHNMRKLKPMLHAQKSMQATKCISVQKLYLHTWTIALGLMYLGTQLGDERSISHVANKFIGTGMMGLKPAAPEPPAPAMADPPGAAATAGTGAGAPIPGFMKAARTPPLSTAVAITIRNDAQAGLRWSRTLLLTHKVQTAFYCSSSLIYTDLRWSEAELRFRRECGANAICGRPTGGAESRAPFTVQ